MMLDEGFHADDPKYRLAQLQDALLRDVRFIVGIKLHTQGMTVDEATELFETAGHQPHPVAVSEAKRGTADPLYGYYTMGKLMILKLRDDYKAKDGRRVHAAGLPRRVHHARAAAAAARCARPCSARPGRCSERVRRHRAHGGPSSIRDLSNAARMLSTSAGVVR